MKRSLLRSYSLPLSKEMACSEKICCLPVPKLEAVSQNGNSSFLRLVIVNDCCFNLIKAIYEDGECTHTEILPKGIIFLKIIFQDDLIIN